MEIDIKVSSLNEKARQIVKAFGHLSVACRGAIRAENALSDGFKELFEDEISGMHNAAVTLRLVRAGLSMKVEAIALSSGAEHEDYVRFVDDEGETVAFVYVR